MLIFRFCAFFLQRYARCAAVSLGALLLCSQLTGCITTAVLIAAQYADSLPPACRNLSSVERAMAARCGGYKPGELIAKDVNARVVSDCPLTNFARNPALWHGLPELLAKGASPERCEAAPLLAMAETTACPAFTQMSASTLDAVRWLAQADGASINGPVLNMLTCPEAVSAGLSSIAAQWVAQGHLQPQQARFAVLSYIHPVSLSQPWVADLLRAGHQPLRAVQTSALGFEQALALGDTRALAWWTQQVPSLVHRAPPKGPGYVPWLPLARSMAPGFASDDAARLRSAQLLIQQGANLNASLPYDRGQSVGDYARGVQPQLWPQLQALWQSSPSQRQSVALQTLPVLLQLGSGMERVDVRPHSAVKTAVEE